MDIHHQYRRFVGDEWLVVVEPGFDVNGLVLNGEPKVIVEFVIGPLRTRFWHFVNLAATFNILVHQVTNLFQRSTFKVLLNPPVRRLREFEPNVTAEIPVAERVFIRRKSSWVSQRCQRIPPRSPDTVT